MRGLNSTGIKLSIILITIMLSISISTNTNANWENKEKLSIPNLVKYFQSVSYDVSESTGKVGMLLYGTYQTKFNLPSGGSVSWDNTTLYYYEKNPSTGSWSIENLDAITNISQNYRGSLWNPVLVFDKYDQPNILVYRVLSINHYQSTTACYKSMYDASYYCPLIQLIWLIKENNSWNVTILDSLSFDNYYYNYPASKISFFRDSEYNLHAFWSSPESYGGTFFKYAFKTNNTDIWNEMYINETNYCANPQAVVSHSRKFLYLSCSPNLYVYNLGNPEFTNISLQTTISLPGSSFVQQYLPFLSSLTSKLNLFNETPVFLGVLENYTNTVSNNRSTVIMLIKYDVVTNSSINETIYDYGKVLPPSNYLHEIFPVFTSAPNGSIFISWNDLQGDIMLSSNSASESIWNTKIIGTRIDPYNYSIPLIIFKHSTLTLFICEVNPDSFAIYYISPVNEITLTSRTNNSPGFYSVTLFLAIGILCIYRIKTKNRNT